LPRAVAPVFPHCRQEADFKLKTPLDSHMLPNASENEPRHAALHGVDICLPASRQKSRSKSRESSNAPYYLIQHCRCGAHRCCGMDRYLNSVSKIPPVLSQFDPFSLEEKAKNLPTQEWLDRNMWPNNVD
jgi:hypothetical protein